MFLSKDYSELFYIYFSHHLVVDGLELTLLVTQQRHDFGNLGVT